MNISKTERSNKFIVNLLVFVCFATNMSQLPYLVEKGLTQLIAIPVWVLVILVLLYKKQITFEHFSGFAMVVGFLLIFYVLLLELLTPRDYIGIQLLYPFYLSLVIFCIGVFSSKNFIYINFIKIINAYIISTVIIAVNIFLVYILGTNFYSRMYVYTSKNSVSQILLTALVFIIVFYNRKEGFILKLLRLGSGLFLILVLLYLKSRASIIGIPVMIIIILAKNRSKTDNKKLIMVSVFVFALLILFNSNFREILVNQVIGGGRDWGDINDLSSGRSIEWKKFPQTIENAALFGLGKYKIESFPLSVLAQLGIPMGILLIATALWPIIWGIKNTKNSEPSNIAFLIIACLNFLNGIFEQLAPFGPGSKNYMLWLMFGILYGLKKKRSTTIDIN